MNFYTKHFLKAASPLIALIVLLFGASVAILFYCNPLVVLFFGIPAFSVACLLLIGFAAAYEINQSE